MKKSRITKLALSGAAVAALAATFSTSTYAWYVSNRQADVTGGYGATGAAGSDGSVLVSWNTGTKNWSRSISFTDSGATHNAATAALQPVHYDTDGFYGLAVSNKATIKGDEAAASDFLTFTIVLKSNQGAGKKTLVTPSIKITGYGAGTVASGTAAAPTAQQVLVGSYKLATSYESGKTYYTRTGAGTTESPYVYSQATPTSDNFGDGTYYLAVSNGLPGKEMNDTFVVDALKAMYVQQVVTGDDTPSYVAADDANVKISSFTDTEPTGANAHTYYTAVTGNTVSWGNAPASASGLETFYITGTTELVVTYNIFLDGGDVDCFNSCVGQNFSFDLTFQAGEPVDA